MLGEIQKYESLCKFELTTKQEHKFLLDIARELDSGEFVLCHRDLQLPNIMVRESNENNASLQGGSMTEAIHESKMDCHNLTLSNLTITENNGYVETSSNLPQKDNHTKYEIKFVDFEYAGFSSIIWELGNFSAELNLSESQVQTLAQIYGNITPRDIYKGQMLSNYIWALWSWIYNRIDLGRDYLVRFDKNLKALT